MPLHLVRKNWSVSSSACIISGYFNKSVFLVLTLTEEYKMFWLGRRAPNISFRFLEHATSVYGMFNRDSGKGTPWDVYISNIFITSWWWWWFWLIWGPYHHLNIVITHMTWYCPSRVHCCLVIMEYTLPLVIRIEGWGPRQKVSGQSPITSTARLHFPRCDFTVKTRGVVRASTIGVLVRQLRQGYRILCKKTSGHCKFMQYCHYFHSDTVCLT